MCCSNLTRIADYLSAHLEELGFIIMSKKGGEGLPLVACRMDPKRGRKYDEFQLAHQLRERGWVVPAYTMAPHSEGMKMLRVVVREDFSKSRCDALIADFCLACETLDKLDEKNLQAHSEYAKHLIAVNKGLTFSDEGFALLRTSCTVENNLLMLVVI